MRFSHHNTSQVGTATLSPPNALRLKNKQLALKILSDQNPCQLRTSRLKRQQHHLSCLQMPTARAQVNWLH